MRPFVLAPLVLRPEGGRMTSPAGNPLILLFLAVVGDGTGVPETWRGDSAAGLGAAGTDKTDEEQPVRFGWCASTTGELCPGPTCQPTFISQEDSERAHPGNRAKGSSSCTMEYLRKTQYRYRGLRTGKSQNVVQSYTIMGDGNITAWDVQQQSGGQRDRPGEAPQ